MPRPHKRYGMEPVTLVDWLCYDGCIVCSRHFFLLSGDDNVFFQRELMMKLDILCEVSAFLAAVPSPLWGRGSNLQGAKEITSILRYAHTSWAFCKSSN